MQRSPCVKAGHGGAQHGVCTDVGLVGGAIEFDHDLVDEFLLVNRESHQRFFKAIVDVGHGRAYAGPQIASWVVVTQFQGFVRSR